MKDFTFLPTDSCLRAAAVCFADLFGSSSVANLCGGATSAPATLQSYLGFPLASLHLRPFPGFPLAELNCSAAEA